ncbi:ABC transporter substrate-binding protein [Gordonia hydrophobica]|uniref:ABC transporter substrate-binding protein n=1 Tax=Gordonia hydrophobica TaxID=40516 RepID=A0ABZ2U5W2_9ACTN|nr:ABC transporter substrate-binding protein [Gordonia hydrophobica]MBM7365596.1 ABC-type nitrate/sulfonate/bicarbonate transport system substrate-binding protein [Gordonia hydrophobica]
MTRFGRRAATVLGAAAAVCAALTLTACGGGDASDGAVVKVGITQGVPGDLMAVVADKAGLFEKRGVNVELMPPSLTTAQSAAVVSGDLTIGTMVPGTMWPAIDRGACVKALGSTLGNTLEVIAQPGTPVTGDPTDPDTTMGSLKGKTIGVTSRGSGMELWISQMLTQAGLDPATDVSFVAVGAPATAIAAFKAKQVDAMYYGPTMEEQLPPSEVTRVTEIVGRDGNALSPLVQGYPTASCQTIEQRPNDITNYCKAMWDAYDYTRDAANDQRVAEWLGELVGVSAQGAPALWQSIKNTYLPFSISKQSWEAQAPFAGSPPPAVPDYATAVYTPCAGGDPR